MSEKFSKEFEVDGLSSGEKVIYAFEDEKYIGAKVKDTNGRFKPLERNSPDEVKALSAAGDDGEKFVVRAYNIVKHGTTKGSYIDTFESKSDEERDAYYQKNNKTYNNAGFVDNDIAKPKSIAYSTSRVNNDVYDAGVSKKYGNFFGMKGQPTKSEIMAYPFDLNPKQDHLKISRYDYRRPDINQSKPAGTESTMFGGEQNVAGDSVKGSNLMGSILLPMPKATDVNGVEWGKSELTISGLAALGAAEKTLSALDFVNPLGSASGKTQQERLKDTEVKRSGGRRKSLLQSLKNAAGFGQANTVQSVTNIIGGALGGELDADTVLARTGGRVLNPNAEMLFQGPVIRDFAFSFVMIARSQKEGDEIRRIIHFLKKGMAPKFRNTTFLASPDIFTLEYKNGPGKNDFLKTVNRFNPGGLALTTMNVDYAPNGYWAAYGDSQPVALKMDLNFTELRPIYEGDQNMKELEGTVGY